MPTKLQSLLERMEQAAPSFQSAPDLDDLEAQGTGHLPPPPVTHYEAPTAERLLRRMRSQLRENNEITRPIGRWYDPPADATVDLRDDVYDFTDGDVDFNKLVLSKEQLARLSSKSSRDFKSRFPISTDLVNRSATDTAKFENYHRTAAILNNAPPSPQETIQSLRDGLSYIRGASGRGLYLDARTDKPVQLDPNIPPEAAEHVFGKLLHSKNKDLEDRKSELLVPDGPYGDEAEIYDKLGGDATLHFLNSRLRVFSARRRWESFLGQKIPLEPKGPHRLSWFDADAPLPENASSLFGVHTMLPVSPFLASLTTQSQNISTAQALATSQEASQAAGDVGENIAGSTLLALPAKALGPSVVEPVAAAFTPSRLAQTKADIFAAHAEGIGTAFNIATAGLIGHAFEGAHTMLEETGAKSFYDEHLKVPILRNFLTSSSDLTLDKAETRDLLLANYPDLSEEDRFELEKRVFSAQSIVADSIASWDEGLSDVGLNSVSKLLAFDDPAMQGVISEQLGVFVDEPEVGIAAALGGALALGRFARWLRGRHAYLKSTIPDPRATTKFRADPRHPRIPKDDGPPPPGLPTSALAGRARPRHKGIPHTENVFDDTLAQTGRFSSAGFRDASRMLKEVQDELVSKIDDPDTARSIMTRTLEVLDREQLPLDPTTLSWMKSSIDEAASRLSKLHHGDGSPVPLEDLKAISERVAPVYADLAPFDRNYILSGDNQILVNPAVSAEQARRARTWLESAIASEDPGPPPRSVTNIMSGPKRARILSALQEGAHREALNGARVHRARTILKDVLHTLGYRRRDLRKQLDSFLTEAEELTREHNRLTHAELERHVRLDTEGGVLYKTNPVTRTRTFRQAEDAILNSRGRHPSALADLLTEPLRKTDGRGINLIPEGRRRPLYKRIKHYGGPEAEAAAREFFDIENPTQAEIDTFWTYMRDSVSDWVDTHARPVAVQVQPGKFNKDLAAQIRRKLDDARKEGQPVHLTPAERNFLGRYRDPKHPLPTGAEIDERLAPYKKQIDTNRRLVDEYSKWATVIGRALPELGLLQRLRLPKDLVKFVDDFLSDPAASIFDAEKKYVPLSEAASATELSGLQAWRETITNISRQERNLRSGLAQVASWEAATLPPSIAQDMLRIEIQNANGRASYIRAQRHLLERRYGQRLSGKELANIYDALAQNKIDSLPKPHQRIAANLARRLTDELVQEAARVGMIDEKNLSGWLGSGYVHGAYLPPGIARKAGQIGRTLNSYLPPRFAPLRVDPSSLKFERPPDSWWVSYRQKGQIKFAKHDLAGKPLTTPQEAARFLETLPENVTEAAINPPDRMSSKLARGLISDPLLSQGIAASELNQAINNFRIGTVVADSPLSRSAGQLIQSKAEPVGTSGHVYELDGRRWVRMPDTVAAGPLRGRYVRDDVFKTINDYADEIRWSKDTVDAVTKAATSDSVLKGATNFGEKAFGALRATLETTGRTLGNALFLSKVATNVSAIKNGILGNLLFFGRAALNGRTLSPGSLSRLGGNFFDFLGQLRKVSKAGTLEASPILKKLIESDVLRLGEGAEAFSSHFAQAIQEYADSTKGLDTQLSHRYKALFDAWHKGDFDSFDELVTDVVNLENKRTASVSKNWKSFLTNWFDKGVRTGLADLTSNLRKTGGKGVQRLWDFYQVASMDAPMKYHVVRELMNDGMPIDLAVERVGVFMQQLHRVNKALRKRVSTFSGTIFAGFTIDYVRMASNYLAYNPGQLFGDMSRLAGLNSATLVANGRSPSEYLAWKAHQDNIPEWAAAPSLATNILLPNQGDAGTGFDEFNLGHAIGTDLLSPQAPHVRQAAERITRGAGGLERLAARLAAAATSRVAGTSPVASFFAGLVTGKDENGDPMRSTSDVVAYAARLSFQPPMAGGYHYQKIAQAAEGTLVDPRDHASTSFGRAVAEVLGARRSGDDLDILSTAMGRYLYDTGLSVDITTNKPYDELRNVYIARYPGAVKPDGTLDPELAKKAALEWYEDIGPQRSIPGYDPEVGPTKQVVENALQTFSLGTKRAYYNDQRLDDMIRIYALTGAAAERIAPGFQQREVGQWMARDIERKLTQNVLTREKLNYLDEARAMIEDNEDIPESVKDTVRDWHTRAVRARSDKMIRTIFGD